MTTQQFNKAVIEEIRAMMRRNEQQVQAVQVCNGGDWPSVEEQQAYWRDKDIGGNVLPDRVQANHDTYQERSLPF